MTRSKFYTPFDINVPFAEFDKDNPTVYDGVDISEYVPLSNFYFMNYALVLGDTGLYMVKGKTTDIPAFTQFEVIDSEDDESDMVFDGNYLIMGRKPYVWTSSELMSGYQRERNQYYVKVTPEEGAGEMDILGLAAGLSYVYGVHFHVHTVDESKKIYHLTAYSGSDDADVVMFNGLATLQKEIHEKHNLWTEVKVNTRSSKENDMPLVPSVEDWDWGR